MAEDAINNLIRFHVTFLPTPRMLRSTATLVLTGVSGAMLAHFVHERARGRDDDPTGAHAHVDKVREHRARDAGEDERGRRAQHSWGWQNVT